MLFATADRLIAVEVKGASAPSTDVVRGLFQCVKYEAVLDAETRVTGGAFDCEAVLALGGPLPASLSTPYCRATQSTCCSLAPTA